MRTGVLAQGGTAQLGNPYLNIGIFLGFVLITLLIVYRVSRSATTASDYYAAGSSFTGPQNGVAISGDYLSAASFLGIAGAIAVNGYDGFLYSIGFLVAWLTALLLVAELLRNVGRFTLGDVLAFRMKQRPVRAAAAVSTLVVSFFYLLAQMAGAGGLISLLLGIPKTPGTIFDGQALVIALVGLVMIVYVLYGGMRGTTWVQIIKATLLVIGAAVMTVWVLGLYGFDLSALLGAADQVSPANLINAGNQYGKTITSRIDFLSLAVALVLGTAGLPHVLMRFYTVPTAQEARRSVNWAIWIIGIFYLFTLVIGYGAAAIVPPNLLSSKNVNDAAPLLAFELGGTLLLGVVSAIAFATILAVVAGLTITSAASFAHDVYASVIKEGRPEPGSEVRVARRTALVVGVVAVIGGILANGQNVAFLVALAFAVAASANLPTLLFSLFWKKFNTTGALFSTYGGLVVCVVLILLSPVVFGSAGEAIFPLSNPGIVSIPLSFLLGVVGTFVGASRGDAAEQAEHERKAAEMEVRSMTGAGSSNTAAPH
ncbi:solute symporter family protein [Actinomycetospora chiangmaiensis]|uniref:solute symporter family protein n=1 Tax=Actinomycetospora chiangmaiensis TaxID=402650 RepID=UPI001FDFDE0D|nr:cation acetate symporter [Actinomycetospora chiangmaiensis]